MSSAYSLFNVGNVVYSKEKARIGKILKIYVKDIKYIFPTRAGHNFLYKDSFNGIWNEEDLCNYDDAIALIYEYKNKTLDQIDDIL